MRTLFELPGTVRRSARFSKDGTRRILLERAWGEEDAPYVLFVMLNPSTANDQVDDPTIRKCVKYVRDWGYTCLRVVNLWDFITPYPGVLRAWAEKEAWLGATDRYEDPSLSNIAGESTYAARTICGWGTWGAWFPERVHAVLDRLNHPHALHITKDGHPGHPLYLPADARPVPYPG